MCVVRSEGSDGRRRGETRLGARKGCEVAWRCDLAGRAVKRRPWPFRGEQDQTTCGNSEQARWEFVVHHTM